MKIWKTVLFTVFLCKESQVSLNSSQKLSLNHWLRIWMLERRNRKLSQLHSFDLFKKWRRMRSTIRCVLKNGASWISSLTISTNRQWINEVKLQNKYQRFKKHNYCWAKLLMRNAKRLINKCLILVVAWGIHN